MKHKMKSLAVISTLAVFIGWGAGQSLEHQTNQGMHAVQGMMHQENKPQIMEKCQMMKNRQQEMMSKMKAADRELESLAQKMKSTDNKDQKLVAMENLLARIVENRTEMHERMMGMMPQMMQHMSGHMQMAQESGDASMMQCPMMSGQGQPAGESGSQGDKH